MRDLSAATGSQAEGCRGWGHGRPRKADGRVMGNFFSSTGPVPPPHTLSGESACPQDPGLALKEAHIP